MHTSHSITSTNSNCRSIGTFLVSYKITYKNWTIFPWLQKLLPCGLYPNPLREKFAKVNDKLDTALSEISLVQLLNVDPGFVNHDQTISHHDLYDYFHLSRNAYLRAFEPLADLLQELLGGDHSESAIARALD